MFDLGLGEVAVLIVAALFVFGPERLPQVIAQAARTLREIRTLAAGARAEINDAIGPELRELNVMAPLAELRDLNPRAMLNKAMFGADDTMTSSPAPETRVGSSTPTGTPAGTPSAAPGVTQGPVPGAELAPPTPAFDSDAT